MEIPQNMEEMEKLIKDAEKRRRFHQQILTAVPASLELMSKGRPSHPLAGKTAKANHGRNSETAPGGFDTPSVSWGGVCPGWL
ncbi:unnamed protein product [marine sediment metagenome]|uniref:Uncharacterized protein n=1 Tax=marine sediment metagenome TaxID=412755 RepID=X1U770_9ZZZZ